MMAANYTEPADFSCFEIHKALQNNYICVKICKN